MNYEGQICRSPMERSSYMLPVAVGCSYNACLFCTLFKHLKNRELPLSQIQEEIRRVADIGGAPKHVFLGDGNAFGMDMDRFTTILDMIREAFPACEGIHMDATVTDIAGKSDEDLRLLSSMGVRRLYLGIESGLEDVLRFMNKDHTLAQAYTQIARIQDVGMIYDAHIMTGIAGAGRGQENAKATAEFLNRTGPGHLVNFSLFLHRKAPLYREIQAGHYHPASEWENLEEDLTLLSLLEVPGLKYDSFHDNLEFRVRGTLPNDKEKMMNSLRQEMETHPELKEYLRYYA